MGKTVTAVNLAAGLARKNRRVLLIDFDPQANSSLLLDKTPELNQPSIYDVLVDDIEPREIITGTYTPNLYILPSNLNLAEAEIDIVDKAGRESLLAEKLTRSIQQRTQVAGFDYMIIDCSPSLSILTVNALTAATEIFVPMQMNFFALKGADHLINIVKLVNEELEHSVEISGVIPTFFEPGSAVHEEALSKVRDFFGNKVFNTVIRRSPGIDKACGFQQTVFDAVPDSDACWDYSKLTEEVVSMEGGEGEKRRKKEFLGSLFRKTQ